MSQGAGPGNWYGRGQPHGFGAQARRQGNRNGGRGGPGGRGGHSNVPARGRGRGRRGGDGGGRGRTRYGLPPVKFSIDKDRTEIEEIPCPASAVDSVRIAVEGCCHGELEAIYQRLQRHERESGCRPIDLLLCCGDFQSLRNLADLHTIAVPPKYRGMGSFYKYYRGELVAPYLTIFVGGNHEASQSLQELHYGGWVAPNMYYMGAAGVVNFAGLRIGGISGIYKPHNYELGRHEKPPYERSTLRGVYHVRSLEVYRMSCLSAGAGPKTQPLDVMVSHDWPRGIEQHGNTEDLVKAKPFFRSEIERNDLGSPANEQLLNALKPKWWFAAHLHVKFRATVRHAAVAAIERADGEQSEGPGAKCTDAKITDLVPSSTIGVGKFDATRKRKAEEDPQESELPSSLDETVVERPSNEGDDLHEEQAASANATTQFLAPAQGQSCPAGAPDLTEQMTEFLSLDKCLPRRHFLTIVDIPVAEKRPQNPKLSYDLMWLAVLRKTHSLSTTTSNHVDLPDELTIVNSDDLTKVQGQFPSLEIPDNFERTVPPIATDTTVEQLPNPLPPPLAQMGNPQTDSLLRKLDLDHIVTIPYSGQAGAEASGPADELAIVGPADEQGSDDNEIDLEDDG